MSLINLFESELDDWRRGYHVFQAVHGTTHAFNEFDPAHIGKIDPGWRGRGFYFSPLTQRSKESHSEEYSTGFAWSMWDRHELGVMKPGSRNIPVMIRMKKPFTEQDAENPQIAWKFHKAGYKAVAYHAGTAEPWEVKAPGRRSGYGYQTPDEFQAAVPEDAAKFTEVAMALGYDGCFWGGEIVVFPPFAKDNIRPLYNAGPGTPKIMDH